MDELTPWWTVVGFLPNRQDEKRGKRWMGNYQALSARVAEDLAKFDVQQEWTGLGMSGNADFWVTGVFPGKHQSADMAYATFLDPDEIDQNN